METKDNFSEAWKNIFNEAKAESAKDILEGMVKELEPAVPRGIREIGADPGYKGKFEESAKDILEETVEREKPDYIEIRGKSQSYIALPNGDNTYVLATAKDFNGKLVPDPKFPIYTITEKELNELKADEQKQTKAEPGDTYSIESADYQGKPTKGTKDTKALD